MIRHEHTGNMSNLKRNKVWLNQSLCVVMRPALTHLPDAGSFCTNKSSGLVLPTPFGFCDISLAHRILMVTHTFVLRTLIEPQIGRAHV